MNVIGERLRQARKAKSYTLDNVAELYNQKFNGGLSRGTLSKYENGKQEPMMSTVINLAIILNVTTDYLCGFENNVEILKEIQHQEHEAQLKWKADMNNHPPDSIAKSNSDFHYCLDEIIGNEQLVDDFFILQLLDEIDRAEIRGEIKQMLKSDKYTEKESLNEKAM